MADISPIEVQKYLAGVDYPATRDDLVDHADGQGAPSGVLDFLRSLADDDFNSPADVMAAFGKR